GTRSRAMTATAPASSAIRACSAVVTSMITPPFSISARPLFTRIVPISAIAAILATEAAANGVRLRGVRLRPPVDERVALEVEQRAKPAAGSRRRGRPPVALLHQLRVVLGVPEEDEEALAVK